MENTGVELTSEGRSTKAELRHIGVSNHFSFRVHIDDRVGMVEILEDPRNSSCWVLE